MTKHFHPPKEASMTDKRELEDMIQVKIKIIDALEIKRTAMLSDYNKVVSEILNEQYTLELLAKQLKKFATTPKGSTKVALYSSLYDDDDY